MRITRIQIDRYGLWRNLDLPLDPTGISVISGPNEAGKSTLLNFLRGVLYGFSAAETHGQAREGTVLGGTLHVVHKGRPLEIARSRIRENSADRIRDSRILTNSATKFAVTGWDRVAPAEEILDELTAGTSRRTFQNLFALGLSELQQLATLHASDAAERMYGKTLGADGKRLLAAIRDGETTRGRLVGDCSGRIDADPRPAEAGHDELAALMQRDAALAAELHALGSQRDEFDRLCRERGRLAGVIDEMKSRQTGMQSQLRGHRFMQRVWDPWSQARDCECQLAEVPVVNAFPPDGLQRLRQLETEIDSDTRCRNTLLKEIAELDARRRTLLPASEALRSIAVLRRFVDRRERVEHIAAERDSTRQAVESQRRALDDACRGLGESWDRERLESVDVSPSALHELLDAARTFQQAIVRRGRFRRAYKAAAQSFRKLRAKTEQGRRRLEERAAGLRQRRDELQRLLERNEHSELVPKWFRRVLWFFAIAGGLVALTGMLTAFIVNAVSGLVLCLAGTAGLGAGWGLKLQSESTARASEDARQAELKTIEQDLQEITAGLADSSQATRTLPASGSLSAEAPREKTISELVAMETCQQLRRRLDRRRRRMTQLRHRFSGVKQDFSAARERWCDALRLAGLDVTLKLDDAFAHCQRVLDAKEQLARLQAAERIARRAERRSQRLQARMQQVAARAGLPTHETDDPARTLDDWQRRLTEMEAARDETRRLREEIHKRRHEARQYGRHLKKLHRRLDALLVQGGADDREDFERRAEAVARRAELEELLEMARDELATVAADEPELAVVEEDLEAYDAGEHAECIRALELELTDLARDLQQAYEELGGVKQALSELAADDRGTKLRIERSRLESKIVAVLEAWLAEGVVAETLDAVKARVERTHQPAVLAAASEYLRRFTRGRYPRVWRPLGRNRLFVDDRREDSWELDELSGGTREQVFLALRLALIDDYAGRGVELPVILDDVLVNFDRQRTEAAVETLWQVASAGRQILFLTCHEHIADAFRHIGVAPLALPDQPHEHEHERRIAG